jgi:hypothetical protein
MEKCKNVLICIFFIGLVLLFLLVDLPSSRFSALHASSWEIGSVPPPTDPLSSTYSSRPFWLTSSSEHVLQAWIVDPLPIKLVLRTRMIDSHQINWFNDLWWLTLAYIKNWLCCPGGLTSYVIK